jgi:uncharacterized protein (DUF342 family)
VLGERRQNLQNAIIKNMEHLEALEADVVFLKKQEQAGLMDEKQRIALINTMKYKFQVQAALKSEQDELQDIDRRLEHTKPIGIVKVKDTCYPGVTITIRGSIHVVRDAFKYVAFIYDAEAKEVRMKPFNEVDLPF